MTGLTGPVGLLCLLFPVFVVAYVYERRWGNGFGRNSSLWNWSSMLGAGLLAIYVGAVVSSLFAVGNFSYRTVSINGGSLIAYVLWSYFTPGIAFAMIIFPKVVAEYLPYGDSEMSALVTLLGWLIVISSVLSQLFF